MYDKKAKSAFLCGGQYANFYLGHTDLASVFQHYTGSCNVLKRPCILTGSWF